MPKSQTVSTASEPKDIDKAFASASKALNILGIKMATKKPDSDKLSAVMTKTKKKAEFVLNTDADGVTLTVDCAGTSTQLGELDIDAVKDPEKRAVVLQSLVSAKLMTQAEMDKAMATMRKGPDPKIAANEIRKKIEGLKTLRSMFEKTTTYDGAAKNPIYFKQLTARAAKEKSSENLMFIAAVEKGFARDKIMAAFVTEGSKYQVNLPSAVRTTLEGGGVDFGPAVVEIKKMVQRDVMTRVNVDGKKDCDGQIKVLETELGKMKA